MNTLDTLQETLDGMAKVRIRSSYTNVKCLNPYSEILVVGKVPTSNLICIARLCPQNLHITFHVCYSDRDSVLG